MKAVQLSRRTKQSLVIDMPKPTPAGDELLVKVVAAAIDTATDQVLNGMFVAQFIHARADPLIMGWHFAGTVEEVGSEALAFEKGDEVFGHLQYEPSQAQGSYSEYITVKADSCAIKPHKVSFQLAAASTTEAMTALQAMRDEGGLKKGMDVLVLGAGGGVGNAAVGIAKILGANVTAVCSSKDIDRVRSLGAVKVLDRLKGQDPMLNKNDETKYDLIFDTPAVYSARTSLNHLKAGGTYVTTLPSWGWLLGFLFSLFSSKKVALVGARSKQEDLQLVGTWLSEGLLEIPIDSRFKIKNMDKALAKQRNKNKSGRVILDVDGGWD